MFAGEKRRQSSCSTVVVVYDDCPARSSSIFNQTCVGCAAVEDVFEDVSPDLRWEAEEAGCLDRI